MFEKVNTTILVGKRGVITIPTKVRELLEINEGDPLKVSVEGSMIKLEIIRGGK